MNSQNFDEALRRLRRTVAAFGRYQRRWERLDGAARFGLAAGGSLLVWFVLDLVFHLSPWPLVLLFAAVLGVTLWTAVICLIRPLFRRGDLEGEALSIEALHGRLDNSLIGALQLGDEVQDARAAGPSARRLGYAANLVEELVCRAQATADAVQPRRLLNLRPARQRLLTATLLLATVAACLLGSPGAVAARRARLLDAYAVVLDTLFPVTLLVAPGDTAIVRGRALDLLVTAVGARRTQAACILTDVEDEAKPGRPAAAAPRQTVVPLELVARQARHRISDVQHSFDYQFRYGRRLSTRHRVRVADLPAIQVINFELTPPAYTEQPMRQLTGRVATLQGLQGTAVMVGFAATTELAPDRCWVAWQNGTRQELEVSGRFGSFAFVIERADRFTIHLTGSYGVGFEMESPLAIDVALLQDQPPAVSVLIRSAEAVAMPPQAAARLNVPWLATDDFGVQEVGLFAEVTAVSDVLGRDRREVTLAQRLDPARDRATGRFENLFATLRQPLAPGDKVAIHLTARDNNSESGPGTARSEPFELLIVGASLKGFTQDEFAFMDRRGEIRLREIQLTKRATDLLQDPVKTVHTQADQAVGKQAVTAVPGHKAMLDAEEDEVGLFRRLLSGSRN